MELYQVERFPKWKQELSCNYSITKARLRSPHISYKFTSNSTFSPLIQDFSVKDQQGDHFFRFQLVNATTLTCSSCFRHYLTSLIGISPQYRIPNQVECSHCHQLIQVPESISSKNQEDNGREVPENDNLSSFYYPATRKVNIDPAGMLDLETFLLKYGRYFTSHITTISFMRIKLPKPHLNSCDSWGLVITCLTDQTLRIHTVDSDARQLASLDLKALYFRSSESRHGLSEMMLRDSNNSEYILNAAASHKWFKYYLINRLSITTTKLEIALQKFHVKKTPSIIDRSSKKGFFSRMRRGAFKKKDVLIIDLSNEQPPSEQLIAFGYFKRKNHPLFITLLPSSRKSVPNLSLHYSDSPSYCSRIPSGTFTASSFSSEELVSNFSSPRSEVGLDLYHRQYLLAKPDFSHHWFPGFSTNHSDSRSDKVSLDTVSLYPRLISFNDIKPVIQFNTSSSPDLNSDLSLLIDQFPTPPSSK